MGLEKHNIFVYTILISINFLIPEITGTTTEKPIIIEYNEDDESEFISKIYVLVTYIMIFLSLALLSLIGLIRRYLKIREDEKEEEEEKENKGEDENRVISNKEKVEIKENMKEMKRKSKELTKDQMKLDKKKQKSLHSGVKEKGSRMKFRNEGAIRITTQNAINADLTIEYHEKQVEKTINQVKWSEEPIGSYEIGPDVDRFDTIVDAKGGGFSSSTVMTASIRKV